jgi:hypothetical protein
MLDDKTPRDSSGVDLKLDRLVVDLVHGRDTLDTDRALVDKMREQGRVADTVL